jgi:hypothetical protein
MEFSVLFLSVVAVMGVSWSGSPRLALTLFMVSFVGSLATYLYHATDVLKLSF